MRAAGEWKQSNARDSGRVLMSRIATLIDGRDEKTAEAIFTQPCHPRYVDQKATMNTLAENSFLRYRHHPVADFNVPSTYINKYLNLNRLSVITNRYLECFYKIKIFKNVYFGTK